MAEGRLVEHFIAVYRHRSFRAAADALAVTQSTVTKSIQKLEAEMDVRLFNRSTRVVEPTDSARRLLPRAEAILQASGAFDAEAKMLAGGQFGSIRVGAIALAAETLIVDSLANLSQSHPNLAVEVVVGSSDIYRDLVTGNADVAIGDEDNFAISQYAHLLRKIPLREEALVFVHRTKHPASHAQDLHAFLEFPFAVPSRYFNENRLFESLVARTDLQDFPRYRLNSLSACLTLAATSDIVTLAPLSVVEQLLQTGVGLEIAGFELDIQIKLALISVARNTPTPALTAFQNAVTSRTQA